MADTGGNMGDTTLGGAAKADTRRIQGEADTRPDRHIAAEVWGEAEADTRRHMAEKVWRRRSGQSGLKADKHKADKAWGRGPGANSIIIVIATVIALRHVCAPRFAQNYLL